MPAEHPQDLASLDTDHLDAAARGAEDQPAVGWGQMSSLMFLRRARRALFRVSAARLVDEGAAAGMALGVFGEAQRRIRELPARHLR